MTSKLIHIDALKMTHSQVIVLIAIQLDVNIDFEKFRPSSTPMRAHFKNEVLIYGMMSKRIHHQTCYVCLPHIVKFSYVRYDATKDILSRIGR